MLSLFGVVLATIIPTFLRSVRLSKISEASAELQRMHASIAAYYARPQIVGDRKLMRCLPEPAGPTPALPTHDPQPVQFGAPETPGSSTWRAIGYEPEGPVRYRYSLLPSSPGCMIRPARQGNVPLLTLRAEGDLDSDGVLSRFERTANDVDGELVLEPLLDVRNRIE